MDITFRDYCLIRNTIIEMLYDRSEQELDRFHFERGSLDIYNMIPIETLEELYNKAISQNISYLNFELAGENQKIQVCFLNDSSKMNETINRFKRIYKLTGDSNLETLYLKPILDINPLIIILCNKKRPSFEYLQTSEKNLEIFWYKQLTFNISKHFWVPKHQLLHPTKKEELKKIYFLDRIDQLPTLLKEDPVAKYYGMKTGDICRIIRENPNIGTSIYYRYVTDI